MDEATDPFSMPLTLRRELLKDGWHDRAIAEELRAGRWARPRRGAYVDAASWSQLDIVGRHIVRSRAALRQANTEVVVSHASAVAWWGGPDWGLDLADDVHLTRRDGKAGRNEAGVHQHCGVILENDVVELHGESVMTPARVALEVTTLASVEVALVAGQAICGLTPGLLGRFWNFSPDATPRKFSDPR
jgi:hypothetical protein